MLNAAQQEELIAEAQRLSSDIQSDKRESARLRRAAVRKAERRQEIIELLTSLGVDVEIHGVDGKGVHHGLSERPGS